MKIEEMESSYRDAIATISKEGKRNFIYPKKPSGSLYRKRTVFSLFYLLVFFTLPFVYVNDEPLLMFNVLERKFIIFGMIFWPQDFFIFGLGMLTFIVFIILFTVVFGRIFCGWACPQTIFMEMVFRKIEYWIDGDSVQQKRLKQMPWNAEKTTKRVLKFIVFFALSFLIANFFLSYLIGMSKLSSYCNIHISISSYRRFDFVDCFYLQFLFRVLVVQRTGMHSCLSVWQTSRGIAG